MQRKTRLLKKIARSISEEIKFEFTSPGTPKKKGVVEQGFATLYYWVHTMMAHVELHKKL